AVAPPALLLRQVAGAALVDQGDRWAAPPGGHDLLAHGIVEQGATSALVTDRSLQVDALALLSGCEGGSSRNDVTEHGERHPCRLPEARTTLREVRLLGGAPLGRLTLRDRVCLRVPLRLRECALQHLGDTAPAHAADHA